MFQDVRHQTKRDENGPGPALGSRGHCAGNRSIELFLDRFSGGDTEKRGNKDHAGPGAGRIFMEPSVAFQSKEP